MLAAGLAEEWIEGAGVQVNRMPTVHGSLSYLLRRVGCCDSPIAGGMNAKMVLRPPLAAPLRSVLVDDSPCTCGFCYVLTARRKSSAPRPDHPTAFNWYPASVDSVVQNPPPPRLKVKPPIWASCDRSGPHFVRYSPPGQDARDAGRSHRPCHCRHRLRSNSPQPLEQALL